MSIKKMILTTAFVVVSGQALAHSTDIPVTPSETGLCVSCHGERGVSEQDDVPHLAGQKSLYLKKRLLDFKYGFDKSHFMTPSAAYLSDHSISVLSHYYSRQILVTNAELVELLEEHEHRRLHREKLSEEALADILDRE